MIIDPAIKLSQPGMISQNGTQINSGQDLTNQVNSGPASSKLAKQKQDPENTTVSSEPSSSGLTASLAVDDNKNVVVRYYDNKGNVVAQYPPKDYIAQMKELNQVAQNLFHTTA